MTDRFHPYCNSVLIGSLPVIDHNEANALVFKYSPKIPVWAQLPANEAEGMVVQFLPGMPGLTDNGERSYINTKSKTFNTSLVGFYEDYLSVAENGKDIDDSRFVLTKETANGFFVFLDHLRKQSKAPIAVKGQVTGPITFTTRVADEEKQAIFYNEQVRDAAVKLLSLKAAWQVKQLSRFNVPVILFIDEPALAGYGSSEFTSISKEAVTACLQEVVEAIHTAGGLAGIHVCANTDWSVILESSADIVNFDAYSFFNRFILYADHIKAFFNSGKILAWGIVPTSLNEDIEKETTESLAAKWEHQANEIENLGIDKSKIYAQSLITPSCGTGSLSVAHAERVLELTRSVSGILKARII